MSPRRAQKVSKARGQLQAPSWQSRAVASRYAGDLRKDLSLLQSRAHSDLQALLKASAGTEARIVITGASSGIGQELAYQMLRSSPGASVSVLQIPSVFSCLLRKSFCDAAAGLPRQEEDGGDVWQAEASHQGRSAAEKFGKHHANEGGIERFTGWTSWTQTLSRLLLTRPKQYKAIVFQPGIQAAFTVHFGHVKAHAFLKEGHSGLRMQLAAKYMLLSCAWEQFRLRLINNAGVMRPPASGKGKNHKSRVR